MEFLTEYGLFLAKTLTFLIAFVVIVTVAVSAGKGEQSKEKGQVEFKKLNSKYEDLKETAQNSILEEHELKALHKEQKEKDKQKKKELKKAAKSKKPEEPVDTPSKRVFVTEFDGDIKASDTESLREAVTAILSVAKETDEVVVLLESQGGMVHSYGLASSQLNRITQKNIPLTICVDNVAASGGYMMACVANKILAAPFAIIGSIGVVAQLPNFHKLLKKHDIDYEMLTAGKYKRTLTMFGENTDKGREKFIEDLEDTHVLFKDFITEHRPELDVEKVATGEIWFGKRALEQNLVDELKTSDEYLLELSQEVDLFEVSYEVKKSLAEKIGVSMQAGFEGALNSLLQKANNKIFS